MARTPVYPRSVWPRSSASSSNTCGGDLAAATAAAEAPSSRGSIKRLGVQVGALEAALPLALAQQGGWGGLLLLWGRSPRRMRGYELVPRRPLGPVLHGQAAA